MNWLQRLLMPRRTYAPSPLLRGVTFTRPIYLAQTPGLVIEDCMFTRSGRRPAITIEGEF